MALEVFALLKKDSDLAQTDHLITGSIRDMQSVVEVLVAMHQSNKRIKSTHGLLSKVYTAMSADTPVVRITKAEARALINNLEQFAGSKASPKHAKTLYAFFSSILAVF